VSECETLTTLTVVLLEEHVVGEEGHAHERGLVLHGSSVLVVEAELVAVRAHLLAALSDARRGELSEEAHVAVGLLGHGTEAALEAELGAAAEAEGASYGEQVVAPALHPHVQLGVKHGRHARLLLDGQKGVSASLNLADLSLDLAHVHGDLLGTGVGAGAAVQAGLGGGAEHGSAAGALEGEERLTVRTLMGVHLDEGGVARRAALAGAAVGLLLGDEGRL